MAPTTSLYGDRDPSKTKTKHKPINSSSSLAFSSNLSSLIASSKTKPTKDPKPTRDPLLSSSSSAPKASLFTAHRTFKNNNPKKRSRDDDHASPNREQQHQTSLHVGRTDESELARSKRKMLEKTRLYNAMKRGEYIGREADYDEKGGLVDFDKKWVDSQHDTDLDLDLDLDNSNSDNNTQDSGSDSNAPTTTEAKTESYSDTFGRLIPCTPSQKRRYLRTQRIATLAASSLADSRAHPVAPESQLIYGDTIQSAAFNPDHVTQQKMTDLAAKRDREETPPEATHYDGKAEVRTRGTGWFAFSKDEEGRKGEMEGLERERRETERVRAEREKREEERRREREGMLERRRGEVEERRRVVEERRRGREVDAFLEGLDPAVGGGGAAVEEPGASGDAGKAENAVVDEVDDGR